MVGNKDRASGWEVSASARRRVRAQLTSRLWPWWDGVSAVQGAGVNTCMRTSRFVYWIEVLMEGGEVERCC